MWGGAECAGPARALQAGPGRTDTFRPGLESPDPGRPGRAAFLVVITWESEENIPFFL